MINYNEDTFEGATLINDIIYHYTNLHGYDRTAFCRARHYKAGDKSIIILTELDQNQGTSVTNKIEWIALELLELWQLDKDNTVWIEHYPDCGGEMHRGDALFAESYSTVKFKWIKDSWHNKWRFGQPDWAAIPRSLVEYELGSAV